MINNKKIVALIPLRGGSKSIPSKNIRKLAGKPLAYWALSAAANSKYIDEVWVSTDSPKIKKVVLGLGLRIKVIDRPAELSGDLSTTESAMLHLAEHVSFDIILMAQATSPLTTSGEIDKALEEFVKDGYDSLVTGVRVKKFFWEDSGKPINYDPANRPMRQTWSGVITENGAFYITKCNLLEKTGCRLGGKIKVFEMPAETELELDEPDDLSKVAKLLKKRKNAGK